jgi:hypothetical protein
LFVVVDYLVLTACNRYLHTCKYDPVHPGYVHTGFGGINQERKEGQRGVDESTRGVVDAINAITMDNTGAFLHGNYGEGVQLMDW